MVLEGGIRGGGGGAVVRYLGESTCVLGVWQIGIASVSSSVGSLR